MWEGEGLMNRSRTGEIRASLPAQGKHFVNRLDSPFTGQGVAAHADGGVSQDRKTKAKNPISDLHLVPKTMLAPSYDPFVATCNTYSISIREQLLE
jgi:hypothetical protein